MRNMFGARLDVMGTNGIFVLVALALFALMFGCASYGGSAKAADDGLVSVPDNSAGAITANGSSPNEANAGLASNSTAPDSKNNTGQAAPGKGQPKQTAPIPVVLPNNSGSDNQTQSAQADQFAPATQSLPSILLTMSEISKHRSNSDCWMVINGGVYDLSSFTSHPGGSAYVPYCGTDATTAFDTKGGSGSPHSSGASAMLPYYKIGNLGQQSTPLPPSAPKPNVTGEEGEHEDEDETEYDD